MVKVTKKKEGGIYRMVLSAVLFSSLVIFLTITTTVIRQQQQQKEDAVGAVSDGGLRKISQQKQTAASPRFVTCTTSIGDFEIELFPETSPNGYHQFLHMVETGFFDQGVAFFRVNEVAIQFGADQKPQFRANKRDPYESVRKPWTMDPNPYNDDNESSSTTNKNSNKGDNQKILAQDHNMQQRRKQHPWTRGTLAMIGGTQMLITRVSGEHTMGTAPHDSPLGKIVGDGMERVFDKLYDGYGNVLDTKNQGLDQLKIFEQGMDYIRKEFPKTDYISHCQGVK